MAPKHLTLAMIDKAVEKAMRIECCGFFVSRVGMFTCIKKPGHAGPHKFKVAK